jgi:hypothetical protein
MYLSVPPLIAVELGVAEVDVVVLVVVLDVDVVVLVVILDVDVVVWLVCVVLEVVVFGVVEVVEVVVFPPQPVNINVPMIISANNTNPILRIFLLPCLIFTPFLFMDIGIPELLFCLYSTSLPK